MYPQSMQNGRCDPVVIVRMCGMSVEMCVDRGRERIVQFIVRQQAPFLESQDDRLEKREGSDTISGRRWLAIGICGTVR